MDESRAPLASYEDLARLIDHPLVRPDLSDEQVANGCRVARQYGVAAVSVRASDVDLVVGWMKGSGVAVGSIVGFPHGSETTAAKIYQTQDLLRRGVTEIDMVVNIGKLISRQFQYIESELLQISNLCHQSGAILKVILETAFLGEDLKVIGCKIAKRTAVDFVKTSTGFAPAGATPDDVKLLVRLCGDKVKVKAAGGIRTLDQALEFYELGCARIGTGATAAILEEWKARLAAQPPSGPTATV
jgi:deoxyribose-phosphate aldolase